MRQKRVGRLNAKIGTTKTEVDELIHKESLTPEEMKRLEEIVEKTHQVKIEAMKELGLETDEVVVEKQRKKQITKRFNIREDWLPM